MPGVYIAYIVIAVVITVFATVSIQTISQRKLGVEAAVRVEEALKKPIEVWCQLHRNNQDYAALVLVHRDGTCSAPPEEILRVLRRMDSFSTLERLLGAPTGWAEKEIRSVSGNMDQPTRFIEMLGSIYRFPK